MPAVTPSKPVLRPPGLITGGVVLVAVVFVAAFVVALPRALDAPTGGDVALVVAVGLVALLMLLGVAMVLTTRVWAEGDHLHVRSLGRHTRRSLRPPATVELVWARSPRNSILPPWRLVLREPSLAPLAIGTYQVGPIAPLLRLVAPYADAEPSLAPDEFTAASLRDPDAVRRPD